MTASLRRALVLCLCTGIACAGAHASERVTLRNGFSVDCARHDVFGDRVRLYLSANNDSYQDLPLLQVAGIETLPEPPRSVPVTPHAAPTPRHGTASGASLSTRRAVSLPPLDVHDLLQHAGAEHNIDVELLASIVHAESDYQVRAVSRAGARGLMQLMPATARSFGASDAFRPEQNIRAGTAFLDAMLIRYHDNLALALAAYNAGPATVERYGGIPPFRETRAYVSRVINEFYRRRLALGSASMAQGSAPAGQGPSAAQVPGADTATPLPFSAASSTVLQTTPLP